MAYFDDGYGVVDIDCGPLYQALPDHGHDSDAARRNDGVWRRPGIGAPGARGESSLQSIWSTDPEQCCLQLTRSNGGRLSLSDWETNEPEVCPKASRRSDPDDGSSGDRASLAPFGRKDVSGYRVHAIPPRLVFVEPLDGNRNHQNQDDEFHDRKAG